MKLPTGKVPPDILLERILPKSGYRREDVVIGPGIGIDSAVTRVGDKYIIISTDPITAATSLIGMLSIHITTNDVVASGALPRWFLSTMLLPKDITIEKLDEIIEDMHRNAEKMEMQIVGGHTEVTPYLESPIIVGTAIGVSDKYVTSGGAVPGDVIMMTKTVAVEGTAVLAYDHEEKLRERGISASVIKKAKEMIYKTSIYPEGRILLEGFRERIHSMHDPTEGGIFTALNEIADASGVGLKIFLDDIPVDEITITVCNALGVNPYLLLSSGTLLFTVERGYADTIRESLMKRRIRATVIGEVIKDKEKRILIDEEGEKTLPRQEKDEIWKLY